MKLTARHVAEMGRAVNDPRGLGVVEWRGGPRGLASAAYERMMKRLVGAGYFKSYVHGGFEITATGRDAFDESSRSSIQRRARALERR